MAADQLPCPPLRTWLPAEVGEGTVGIWIKPAGSRWRARVGVRRLLRALATDDGGPLDALVVAGPLVAGDPGVPDEVWDRLRPGGTLVEIATHPRPSLLDLVRPLRAMARRRRRPATRVEHWCGAGVCQVQQWAPLESRFTVVTTGLRAP